LGLLVLKSFEPNFMKFKFISVIGDKIVLNDYALWQTYNPFKDQDLHKCHLAKVVF